MRFSELFKDRVIDDDCLIRGLCCNSSQVLCGDLFFSLEKDFERAKKYVFQAYEKGASGVVCSRSFGVKNEIVVPDVHQEMKRVANLFYDNPRENLTLVGVTGTNGKTTTTHIIYDILSEAKIPCGIIGTLGAKWSCGERTLINTTPGYLEFMKTLFLMKKDGVRVVLCEASAHAVVQNRLEDLKFDIGVFTNLSQDHLDYFESMEKYEKAKIDFFSKFVKGKCVVNTDSQTGKKIYKKYKNRTLTYGIDSPADFYLTKNECLKVDAFGEVINLKSPLYGRFNEYNLLASISVCKILGLSWESIEKGVQKIKVVPGRFNVYKGKKTAIIDYAHTPDGLENVLKTCRPLTKGKVICVFGCGGDRDKEKRAIMGKISQEYADLTILTEDNSRSEKTKDIVSDVLEGMNKKPIIILSRKNAIKRAFKLAKEEDVILIAGKGAENYIEKKGKKIHFSDQEIVKKLLGIKT